MTYCERRNPVRHTLNTLIKQDSNGREVALSRPLILVQKQCNQTTDETVVCRPVADASQEQSKPAKTPLFPRFMPNSPSPVQQIRTKPPSTEIIENSFVLVAYKSCVAFFRLNTTHKQYNTTMCQPENTAQDRGLYYSWLA